MPFARVASIEPCAPAWSIAEPNDAILHSKRHRGGVARGRRNARMAGRHTSEKRAPQEASLAVFAIKEMRAETAGTMTELQHQIAKHWADRVQIDYAIRLVEPTCTVMDTRERRVPAVPVRVARQ
jgi:hypothetical protein